MENRPWEVLLGLLRLALWGDDGVRSLLPLTVAEWEQVRRLAREQSLTAVVCDGVAALPREERPPVEMWLRWLGAVHRVEERNRQVNTALERLHDEVVPLLPYEPVLLKGQGVALNWPEPLHRTAGDIDWLVGTEGWERLLACERAGRLTFDAEREKHLEFMYNAVPVECHRTALLFYDRHRRRVWRRIEADWLAEGTRTVALTGGGRVKLPLPGFDALYLFVHAFLHFVPEGVGLRQLTDWALLLARQADRIDGARLLREADALGLTSALGAFGYAAVYGVGMPRACFPLPVDKWREGGEWLLADIREGGNFGRNRDVRDWSRKDTWREELRILLTMERRCRRMGGRFGSLPRTYPWLRSLNYLRKFVAKCLADRTN